MFQIWFHAKGFWGLDTSYLFTTALQLQSPWKVESVDFRDAGDGRQELRIAIGFEAGSRFCCPEPGCDETVCPVHDTRERTWRHPDFFRYKAFILCFSKLASAL